MRDDKIDNAPAALADDSLNAVAGGYSPFDKTLVCPASGKLTEEERPGAGAMLPDDALDNVVGGVRIRIVQDDAIKRVTADAVAAAEDLNSTGTAGLQLKQRGSGLLN